MSNIFKLIRVEQWIKNLLIFSIPILANEFEFQIFTTLLKVFFGFSLIASSGYIVNDLLDIESDKNHYKKNKRVLASGKISTSDAKKIFLITLVLGCSILYIEGSNLLLFSLTYLTLSMLYSKFLKYYKYIDLLLISLFFVLRVYLGSIASGIEASLFLILLIFFSSLSIVVSKKLSILLDKNIKISKVKQSINNNYSSNMLKNLLIFTIVSTFFTYNLWILSKSYLNLIFLVSNVFFILFSYKFYILSVESKTEDFIKTLKSEMLFFTYIVLFISFSLYGIIFY